GIIYISHRLDEIDRLADRVSILRDGCHIATMSAKDVERDELIELMVGRKLENEFPERRVEVGEPRLTVDNHRQSNRSEPVSFEIRRGEVVGLTGLVGAGRTELARVLFGADPHVDGKLSLDGKPLRLKDPREAIAAGICLLTEDRKEQGLILGLSVRENFGLPNLDQFNRAGLLRQGEERAAFEKYVDKFNIRVPHSEQRAGYLSGGNQQKVVLAKWLFRNTEVLLFDEPTRGIDVGAKFEIYQLINELAAAGKAILMISSELPEVIGMSDRILVMREGAIEGEITDMKSVTQEAILSLAMGEG
ncbi:MAG: sugar ABC transporter ATP-binding protein, partial [Verrucomicrobiales bacterium]